MNWKDITYRDYLKLEEFQQNKETFVEQTISYLFKCKATELPIADYLNKSKELSFLNTEIPKVKMLSNYNINGTEYNVQYQFNNFIAGQYMDFTNYISKGATQLDLLSVIMVPLGHKYNDGYDLNKVREDILSMRLVDVMAMNAFFLRSLKRFINLLIYYLKSQVKEMNLTQEQSQEILDQLEIVGEYFPTY